MAYLSMPIGDLQPAYDVVVVGSGYGGAIAALRMSERGSSVCVLERGIERQAGEFPSTIRGALREFQLESRVGRVGRRTALFDMRVNQDVSVLVGCGLGGTSLINAGVMLEPLPSAFTDKWPEALQQPNALTREFYKVRKVLGARKVPRAVVLPKVSQLFEAGRSSTPQSPGRRPPIAVSFFSRTDKAGIRHRRCTLCGDCFSGCNHGAKNTVDRTYLARAETASIFCGIDVRTIELQRDGTWLLHVRILDRSWRQFGEPELSLRAGAVFLAAGTLGSTEILTRSRNDRGLAVSSKLGERFSGNGDAIAFGYNSIERVDGIGFGSNVPDDAAVGPTIAGMLDERSLPSKTMIQEGAVPGLLGPLLRVTAPIIARVTRVPGDMSFDLSFRHLWREAHSLLRGVHHGALARTQTFLCMSIDDGDGQMGLVRDRLRISWKDAGLQAPFRRIAGRLAEITRARRGRFVINPFWSRLFGRRLVTVHPLGGCAMADDASCGVVNDSGRVFSGTSGAATHQHLYVSDGSIVPTALGVNPALTISALAERIANKACDPPNIATPPRGRPVDPAVAGIRYAERLRGWLELDGRWTRLELVLHISAENIDHLLEHPEHVARVIGVARTPQLDVRQWTISSGTLNVMTEDPRQTDTTLLVYQLRLTAPDGRSFWLTGHKTLNLATTRRGTWRAITEFSILAVRDTVPLPVPASHPQLANLCDAIESLAGANSGVAVPTDLPCAGHGKVRASVPDTLRLAASVKVLYERSLFRRLAILFRFAWFFADGVFQARVWPLRRAIPAQPFHRPTLPLPNGIEPHIVTDTHILGPRFLLTRYRGDNAVRGPVVLAPGFGMAADCFLVGAPSLVEHLCEQGYDVWLLDYRGSDHLPISLSQFTLDELVDDFADAFARVREQAEGRKVRVIAHCVASLVTTMTLLRRGDAGQHVQSAILSQTHVFQDHPFLNRLKAWVHLPQLLKILGFRPVLTSDHDVRSGRLSRLLDRLLHLYPTVEHCSSPVCRRTLLMYGEVIHHDNIDRDTHDLLYDLFDRANLTLLEHMSLLVRRGHAVDKYGREAYLTAKNGARLTMPITIIQGQLNRLFRPIAAERTYEWMLTYGGGGNRRDNERLFTLKPFERYAHLDHFLGKDAARDVYPELCAALQRMDDIADGRQQAAAS